MTVALRKKTAQIVSKFVYHNGGVNVDGLPNHVENLHRLKREAVQAGKQDVAKEIWILESVITVHQRYCESYSLLKSEKYYEGWCLLERAEILLNSLIRHADDDLNQFGLEFLQNHIPKLQSIFPYRIFFSPEIVEEELKCSICGSVQTIRKKCAHEVGEIYDGELCCRIVSKMKILGISIVTEPVQKYSVGFVQSEDGTKIDDHDYSLVNYLMERLTSPYHVWGVRWKRIFHPHKFYKHVHPTDKCPCGSDKTYRVCCLRKPGVQNPHCEFTFSVPPKAELLKTIYINDRGERATD